MSELFWSELMRRSLLPITRSPHTGLPLAHNIWSWSLIGGLSFHGVTMWTRIISLNLCSIPRCICCRLSCCPVPLTVSRSELIWWLCNTSSCLFQNQLNGCNDKVKLWCQVFIFCLFLVFETWHVTWSLTYSREPSYPGLLLLFISCNMMISSLSWYVRQFSP